MASSRRGRGSSVECDEEQQAEIVAEGRLDGVVVDEVAEVVEDVVLDGLEDVG
jgi:hypothetical protein